MITQGMEKFNNHMHGDSCYGNRSEEVTGDGATVNMEMSLMNQSEDDHSGGEEGERDKR